MNRRTILLVVAGALALGAGLLAFNFLTAGNHKSASAPRAVVVATRPISAHTSITPDMVEIITRDSSDVDPNALSDTSQVEGDIALGSIPAGAAITSSNAAHSDQYSVALRLRPGMRAISIPVDDVKDVSGLVQPGDRVDVVASVPRTNTAPPHAYTILRDAIVLAVGGAVANAVAAPSPGPGQTAGEVPEIHTVTLEVTPSQSDLITMADLNTVLRLALRSPRERSSSYPVEAVEFASDNSTIASEPRPAAGGGAAPAPAAPARPAAPPSTQRKFSSPVEVIDGDKIDDRSK